MIHTVLVRTCAVLQSERWHQNHAGQQHYCIPPLFSRSGSLPLCCTCLFVPLCVLECACPRVVVTDVIGRCHTSHWRHCWQSAPLRCLAHTHAVQAYDSCSKRLNVYLFEKKTTTRFNVFFRSERSKLLRSMSADCSLSQRQFYGPSSSSSSSPVVCEWWSFSFYSAAVNRPQRPQQPT